MRRHLLPEKLPKHRWQTAFLLTGVRRIWVGSGSIGAYMDTYLHTYIHTYSQHYTHANKQTHICTCQCMCLPTMCTNRVPTEGVQRVERILHTSKLVSLSSLQRRLRGDILRPGFGFFFGLCRPRLRRDPWILAGGGRCKRDDRIVSRDSSSGPHGSAFSTRPHKDLPWVPELRVSNISYWALYFAVGLPKL